MNWQGELERIIVLELVEAKRSDSSWYEKIESLASEMGLDDSPVPHRLLRKYYELLDRAREFPTRWDKPPAKCVW